MTAPAVENSSLPAFQPSHVAEKPSNRTYSAAGQVGIFRKWYWLAVPLLAIAAYVTALRVGYLADDFLLLSQADQRSLSLESLLPARGWFLYRPLGQLFIWDVGVRLWGYNPFPLHLQSLLLHALAALALGFWLAEATLRRWLGWLAGAVFAVFPLHLEAVGWLAAQWDVLSALFGILGLWAFTAWWRRGGAWLYIASLLLYALALFTKDSLVTFLPMFALSAWLVTPRPTRKDLLRAFFALAPFGGVLALNLWLRLAAWDHLGGYPNLRTDYANFFWDSVIGHVQALLSPINTLVLGSMVGQVVGALCAVGLLLGLALYGRRWLRLLVVAGGWVVLALVPVLNLSIKADDLQQNRLLYLASAGYCVGVAAFLYSAVRYARPRWRAWAASGVGVLLLLSIAACWVQLRPWHTATVQVEELNGELLRLVPPPATPRPNVMTWYVEDSPQSYKGAYLLQTAVNMPRYFIGQRDVPAVLEVQPATDAPLSDDPYDAFALHFSYYELETRFHVDYASGITAGGSPPSGRDSGEGLQVWDFRGCAPDTLGKWQALEATSSCEPGPDGGLALRGSRGDTQLWGPDLDLRPLSGGYRFVRLRASVRYPSNPQAEPASGEWYWKGDEGRWSEGRSQKFNIRQVGLPHVYWTFVPAGEAGEPLRGLRFDPVDRATDCVVQWIAVDLVK